MSILLTAFTMLLFAAIYAVVLSMLGARSCDLFTALLGRPARSQVGTALLAASRRFNLA